MGLTQQIGASSLIKPGVIDNTAARPASPYEGQVIFQKDTDQLLVWNGTAWVIPNQTTQNPEGLELVKTQTVGSTVPSVTVSNVFSSTYDTYRIIYTNGIGSAASTQIGCKLGSTTTGYRTNLVYQVWNSSTVLGANGGTGYFQFIGGMKEGAANTSMYCDFELTNPFLTKYTFMSSQMYGADTTSGASNGILTNTTSYTDFTLTPDSGTLTGGTIQVYGYRK